MSRCVGEVVPQQGGVEGVGEQRPFFPAAEAEDVLLLCEFKGKCLFQHVGHGGGVAAHLELTAVGEYGTVGIGYGDRRVDIAVLFLELGTVALGCHDAYLRHVEHRIFVALGVSREAGRDDCDEAENHSE